MDMKRFRYFVFIFVFTAIAGLNGETLELRNGDRFQGKLLSVQDENLEWQHVVLGKLTIPRDQVAAVYFIPPREEKNTETGGDVTKLKIDPETVDKVRLEVLGAAPQGAHDMFNEMISGLSSGEIQMADVRRMAMDTVAQVESLQEDLGEDVGFALDGYLGILKNFIQKTAPPTEVPTQGNASKTEDAGEEIKASDSKDK